MCKSLSELLTSAEKLAASFDPDVIHPKDQPGYLEKAARLEKIASSIKTLVASKISQSGNWRSEGDKSAANFVSRKTGETVKDSITLIETGKALKDLPRTDEAFRSGRLTGEQAAEIASAATVAPGAEDLLIQAAETQGLLSVREHARRLQAAAEKDQEEKARRLHRQRYLRTWIAPDGAFRLSAQLTPEAGAEIKAVLDARARRLVKKMPAPRARDEAVLADALLETARAGVSGAADKVDAQVIVRVDLNALTRGQVVESEVCEASGIGPISVPGAKEFLENRALVRVVGIREGKPVRVLHAGRYRPPKKGAQRGGDRSHTVPVRLLVTLSNGERRWIDVEPAEAWDRATSDCDEHGHGRDRSPP